MSTGRKKVFLQKKRSFTLTPKESNNTPKLKKKSSKGTLIKGPWTSEEDKLLLDWISKNGVKNWTKCAQFIPGRSGKQCREHWNNSLNSEIVKGNWSSEEDFLIMKFYQKFNGSWKKMIPIFKSRTENSIKNRFYSQLRKIASKYIKTGKKEYSTIFGLDILLKYFDMGMDEAEKKFLSEHPMSENELKEYINKIENMVKNKPKGEKFINLDISIKTNNNRNINDDKCNINNDKNNTNDNNIDINESEDEFNESLKKFSKTDENLETIKKNIKSKKIEEEEKNKKTINPEESKTYEETFEVIIKDDKEKQKSSEKKNNIEENNINLTEKKNEIQNINNNDYIGNNNEKNNTHNNNNIIQNNYFNVHNTYNYNINNNNLNNSLYNKNNYNMNNINDNNSNFATNITGNYGNSSSNYYPFSNQRTSSNIFKPYNNLLSKKSSDLSEHIKNNDHNAIENKYNNISNLDVFKLLNTYNTPNNGFLMGSNFVEPNYCARLPSGEFNAFTPTPNSMFDKKFQNNYYNNNFLSKRSESYDFSRNVFQRLPSNTYGFNNKTSFTSIKDKNIDEYTFDEYNKKL